MKIVLQRVKDASVSMEDALFSEIGPGLLLLVGVAKGDGEAEAGWLAERIEMLVDAVAHGSDDPASTPGGKE